MIDFMEFYADLAPQGETMLVVKQVRSGAMPAFLPSAWSERAASWFGNTGSFVVDRMGDKISASAVNIDRVAVFLFDDVGSKSKAPPLKPTWVMETSPGNFQWVVVYPLDEQPTPGEHCAAQRALAAAGYTDAGAGNAVRNFRLPGSVNNKPGKDKYRSKLVEFNPDVEMTLAAICAACEVTPGEADRPMRSVALTDDGNDDVLKWIASAGYLLSGVNSSGWAGVQCPNAAEHTDGNPEGRYMPSTRSYTCMHEHCLGVWDSERFLEWVELSGGPAHKSGLRDDLLAFTMQAALAKLQPTAAFPDQATQVIAETLARDTARRAANLTKEELHDRWSYVEPDDAYFDIQERRQVSRRTFDAIYRHLDCRRGKMRIEASRWFDEHREVRGGRVLRGVTYAAGDMALCVSAEGVFGNSWHNLRPAPVAGSADLWLDHCRRMAPDPVELDHVWNCMAFKLQFPREKINHAVLHGGPTRCGKDTMWAPFFWSIRGDTDKNVALVSSETLGAQWGYDLMSEVVVLNELRQSEAHDRRALENKLKPIIAAPPQYLPVNRKGMHPVNVVNRLFVMAFSNFRDAIALPRDDGRWFVIWSDCEAMTAAQAMPIWTWYLSGGFAAVAAWLMARDVSKFNPAAHPMWTEAKAVLCEQSLNSAEAWLVDAIRTDAEFARGVVAAPWHGLLDRLQGRAPTGLKLYRAALFHALAEAGWRDMGHLHSTDHMTKKRIFVREGFAKMNKSDIRRMAEESATITAVPGISAPAAAKENAP